MSIFSGRSLFGGGPPSLPTIGEEIARHEAMKAQAGILEQQRQAAWYQAHPGRAVHILGHEGAAAIGIETPEFQLEQQRKEAEMQVELQADQWESEYTFKQKQRIAGIQNGIEQARASGNFNESQMQQIEQMGSMQIMGISPTLRPKDDGKKQMEAWAKEGKGVGVEWLDEWGNVKTREPDGKLVTQVTFDKTRAGVEAKLQREREKDLAEMRTKLEELTIKDPLKETERPKYSPMVVEAKLERMYGWYRKQQIEAAIEEGKAVANTIAAEEESTRMREADMGLPPEVVQAQDYMREIMEEYGGGGRGIMDILLSVPEEKREAAIEAYNILMQAQNQLGQ